MRNATRALVIAAAAGGLALLGCESDQKASEHPGAEHPQAEHPEGDHPESEHPDSEHPEHPDR